MTNLQREIYKSILASNLSVIESLSRDTTTGKKPKGLKALNNMLMQLRKWVFMFELDFPSELTFRCLQHPFLINRDIEREGLSPEETHNQLVNASSKLRLLRNMLPKLRDKGHRVLLFSQVRRISQ
jgi:chromodomain-helicase-DNA-binding protein 4